MCDEFFVLQTKNLISKIQYFHRTLFSLFFIFSLINGLSLKIKLYKVEE